MEPQISIVIPTLNEEHYLPLLLDDLVKQTNKQFTVVVVDGHSEDKTREKALEFRDKLDLQFVESPKRHLATQRNFGAEKSKGKYLFFLDADTRLDPDVIEKLVHHINKEGDKLYLPENKPTNPTLTNRFLFSIATNSVKALHALKKPMAFGPLILISRDLFNKIGAFNTQTTASEDHNLVIKAYKAGVTATILPDVKVYFSTRRLDTDGAWHVVWQYTWFTLETLIKGGVYAKSVNYEMGGQNYEKNKTAPHN